MKKTIRLTENDLYNIINESVKILITESQESKSQSEAIKYLIQNMNWDKEKANNFVRNDLRQDITALRDKNIAKFTLGVTRMFCDRQLSDAHIISNLNATLKLLSAHLNEYDRNLNGISAQELIDKFAQTRQDNIDAEKGEIDSMDFSQGSRYQIVPINSFEEAQKYYEYTNPDSRWCLTHMDNMFDSYTSNGINQIYFCLREGFENEPCEVGENAPLDDYGLSMLSIIVNENGELAYCTTRWNHDNGGSDSSMSAKEISQVVGVNFYQVFKPNNKWQNILSEIKEKISRGVPYDDIFDSVYYNNDVECTTVEFMNKRNVINSEGNFISDKWFDWVGNFEDNKLALVELKSKWNFINTNGEIISNQWFDRIGIYNEGFALVELKGKGWNFINTNGEFIGNQWFDDANIFNNGFAGVSLERKYNFINTDGEFISKQWFDGIGSFNNGFAWVKLNDKYNSINTNGELISNQWFDDVNNFKNGYSIVELNHKHNFINTNGELISEYWFDYADDFSEGFAKIKTNYGWNFINTEGQIAFPDQWFDMVHNFNDGFACVGLNGKFNFINTNGEILYENWFSPILIRKRKIELKKQLNITNENKKYKNMKKTINLTESELKEIIKESVIQVLNEGKIGNFFNNFRRNQDMHSAIPKKSNGGGYYRYNSKTKTYWYYDVNGEGYDTKIGYGEGRVGSNWSRLGIGKTSQVSTKDRNKIKAGLQNWDTRYSKTISDTNRNIEQMRAQHQRERAEEERYREMQRRKQAQEDAYNNQPKVGDPERGYYRTV